MLTPKIELKKNHFMTIFIFLYFSTMGLTAGHSIEKDIYHLHQSLNYFSVYAAGHCEVAQQKGQIHFTNISEKIHKSSFEKIYFKIKKMKKISVHDIAKLEELRLKFSEALENNHIEHKMEWHREIEAACPHATKIN